MNGRVQLFSKEREREKMGTSCTLPFNVVGSVENPTFILGPHIIAVLHPRRGLLHLVLRLQARPDWDSVHVDRHAVGGGGRQGEDHEANGAAHRSHR